MLKNIRLVLNTSAVFYAQFVLVTNKYCLDVEKDCDVEYLHLRFWLLLETISFYSLIASTTVFIIKKSLWSEYQNERNYCDIDKYGYDFIEYMESNLFWYALNFVSILVPIALVSFVHDDLINSKFNEDTEKSYSHEWLVLLLMGAQFVVFFLCNTFYIRRVPESLRGQNKWTSENQPVQPSLNQNDDERENENEGDAHPEAEVVHQKTFIHFTNEF